MLSESQSSLAQLIEDAPWFLNRIEFSNRPPGMLGLAESALYYYLAKEVFQGSGTIIDAGSFLGRSAFQLAQGLRANPHYVPQRDRIHCFDNFIVNGIDTVDFFRAEFDRTVAIGDSTREIFDANIAPVADLLRIHSGDFHTIEWAHEPVEMLVVDIAKSPTLGGRVMENFFPDLIPGESLVIHQDYHHPWLPHIHVTMEYLADYFELVIPRVDDSAVFLYRHAIPAEMIQRAARYDFSDAEKAELMSRAVSRLPAQHRVHVELAGIVLRAPTAPLDELRQELDALELRFQEELRHGAPHSNLAAVRHYVDVHEGWRSVMEQRFERALELSDRLLARERTSQNLTMRACALLGLERFREAEEQLRQALEFRPPAAWAYLELSRALMSQNKLAEAEAVLLSGLPEYERESVSSNHILDYLSYIWAQEHPLADKTELMTMLHHRMPGDPELWVLDARRLMLSGDCTAARQSLEKASQMGLPAPRLQEISGELDSRDLTVKE